ncbi:hypothetical protein KIH79_06805 [Bifidobacterium sp. 82T10]|uniref:Uncharacterized protein n=1 Tax=Bifidobacterium miconis TaxID=2834435 RepID=A0ABS6WF63_9BIFI|nr:hypothetical protein [Bifidobacterium miconis]MBW3092660.1 hypothetical protein [Bifidobacterium miconis]
MMDNDSSVCARLAMMLDENPSCRVLILGRYMPPVRAAYNTVRHRAGKARLRQTLAGSNHLRSSNDAGGRLEAFAPIGLARGLKVDAVLYVGAGDEHTSLVLEGFAAGGAIVYHIL